MVIFSDVHKHTSTSFVSVTLLPPPIFMVSPLLACLLLICLSIYLFTLCITLVLQLEYEMECPLQAHG